jgi:hypothetical protein
LPAASVQCSVIGNGTALMLDPFPESFEADHYMALHGQDYEHYVKVGRDKGMECSKGQRMKELFNSEILPKFQAYIESIAEPRLVLEIGPFLNPMVVGDNVRYFDVLDLEGLKQRAKAVGYPEINPVDITYVHPNADLLSAIPERHLFLLVASSNVLPNQLDLIQHLLDVGTLLVDGGYYAMTVRAKQNRGSNLPLSHQSFLLGSPVGRQALCLRSLLAGNGHCRRIGRSCVGPSQEIRRTSIKINVGTSGVDGSQ